MTENWKLFKQPNLGLLFNRRIYRQEKVLDRLRLKTDHGASLEFEVSANEKTTPFDEFYSALFSFRTGNYAPDENPAASNRFSLFTTYPGLLAGSGYTHDSNAKGDVKLGFFFDHTTGLPVIPGSSVKGLIRSVFELDQDEKGNKITWTESVNAIMLFLDKSRISTTVMTPGELDDLKSEIFGGADGSGTDIFFDAVADLPKTGNRKILGNDFITPHLNRAHPELSPFTNPIPIQFIKVLAGIAFEFRFRLSDSKNRPEWTSAAKEKLFRTILLTLGIGAKTNVGYGQFTEKDSFEGIVEKRKLDDTLITKDPPPPDRPENKFHQNATLFLKKNKHFTGIVSDSIGKYDIILFDVNGFPCRYAKMKKDDLLLAIGEQVEVFCSNDYQPGQPNLKLKKLKL